MMQHTPNFGDTEKIWVIRNCQWNVLIIWKSWLCTYQFFTPLKLWIFCCRFCTYFTILLVNFTNFRKRLFSQIGNLVGHDRRLTIISTTVVSAVFIFLPNDNPLKTRKSDFYFIKSSFCSQDIQIFVFPSSPLFLSVGHYFRGWLKINLKVDDTINCLKRNLITHFVWYLEKEKRYDIETLSIDRILNKEHFCLKNYVENAHQMLVAWPFFSKQRLNARNCFKNKIFWKKIIKKTSKN